MKISGIYKIVHLASGRCYVGQSQEVSKRWKGHFNALRRGYHHSRFLQNAWFKYGEESFSFELVEECPIECLNEREQHWFDTLAPAFNNCKIAGSTRGRQHSEETRLKISQQAKGRSLSEEHKRRIAAGGRGRRHSEEVRAKISKGNIGKKVSEHSRAKISEALKGRSLSEETRRKIGLASKGRKHSPEAIAKISQATKGNKSFLGRKHSKETLEKMAHARRVYWENIRKEKQANDK